MNTILLHTGQILSLGAKLFAAVYLWYSYRRSLRKSALIFSLALFAASLQVFGDFIGNEPFTAVMEAFTSSLLFYGSLKLLEEEGLSLAVSKGWYVSTTPFILTLYMLTANYYIPSSRWLATIGIAYAVSGLFIILSGMILATIKDIYGNYVRDLGFLLILNGAHEMDYPLLRPVEWFAPIGFSLSAALTLLIAYFFVRFSGHENFIKPPAEALKPLEGIPPGITVLSPKEYLSLLPKLQDHPLLAFIRNPNGISDKWVAYVISQVEREHTVSPTNIPRITETIVRYLQAAGKGGVVLIDGIEYLNMYNGFEAIAKFLSTIRDVAYINEGSIIVVTEEDAWNEREWKLLMRLVS